MHGVKELGRYINLGKNLEAQKDKAAKVKKRKTEAMGDACRLSVGEKMMAGIKC